MFVIGFIINAINQYILLNTKNVVDIEDIVKVANERERQSGNSGEVLTPSNSEITEKEIMTQEEGSAYLTMYGEHRVKGALKHLPKWLTDYFTWHKSQTEHTTQDTKYLVMTCNARDKCGGFSDRLRALPYMLFVASRSKRVICIHWSKPFGLEAFLKPLPSGIDWRCPSEFKSLVDNTLPSKYQNKFKHNILFSSKHMQEAKKVTEHVLKELEANNDTYTSIGFKDQDFVKINEMLRLFYAYSYTDRMPDTGQWMHAGLLEHIFRVMFEPIEPIARSINATMTKLGLVERKYTSVHVRARYPTGKMLRILGGRDKADGHDKSGQSVPFEGDYKSHVVDLAMNAIDCGVQLAPTDKIFFSSDSVDLTEYMISKPFESGKTNDKPAKMVEVLGIDSREEIKHLEGTHPSNTTHYDFYPVIEDLLIMGGSRCVAHGIGSFGAFGSGLAGNVCRNIHRDYKGRIAKCPNTRGDNLIQNITDGDLIFGEKSSEKDGRLEPAQGIFWEPHEWRR